MIRKYWMRTTITDIVYKNLTGKSVTECTSDFIIDTAEDIGETISGAASSVSQAVSGWLSKLTADNE